MGHSVRDSPFGAAAVPPLSSRQTTNLCVSGVVVENPGCVERQTSNGPACGVQCGCAGRFFHQSSVRLLARSSRQLGGLRSQRLRLAVSSLGDEKVREPGLLGAWKLAWHPDLGLSGRSCREHVLQDLTAICWSADLLVSRCEERARELAVQSLDWPRGRAWPDLCSNEHGTMPLWHTRRCNVSNSIATYRRKKGKTNDAVA